MGRARMQLVCSSFRVFVLMDGLVLFAKLTWTNVHHIHVQTVRHAWIGSSTMPVFAVQDSQDSTAKLI